MAGPSSRGFDVNVMPVAPSINPGLFNTGSSLAAGLGQGAQLGAQLAQIYQEAQTAPLRRQLAQIQVQDAQRRLDMAPLEQQLRLAQIAEAQQNAAVPRETVDSVNITGGEPIQGITNPGAAFPDIEIGTIGASPRVRTVTGTRYGAGGVATPFEKTETLATGQQVKSELDKAADLADYRASIAEARGLNAKTQAELAAAKTETDRYRAESDRIKAEAAREKVALLENNPNNSWRDIKQADGHTYREYYTKNNPANVIYRVDRGIITNDFISALNALAGRVPAANGQPIPAAAAPAVPAAPVATVDPRVQELYNATQPAGAAVATPTFATEAEAAQAAAAGQIGRGQKIIIGGVTGTWQ